jgi:formylglycine-generating enzyme required for sulfatase activity
LIVRNAPLPPDRLVADPGITWDRGADGYRLPTEAEWGLFDMLGNVWEWRWDLYDAEVYGPYRVLRGGGWFDEKWSCRASVRRRSHPTLTLDDVGFRVARNHPLAVGQIVPPLGRRRPKVAVRTARNQTAGGWEHRGLSHNFVAC